MIVAAAWQKLDRASAEAWIETLELSEEARVKIARVRPGLTTGQQLVIQEEKTP
jgi:hypothetical protein